MPQEPADYERTLREAVASQLKGDRAAPLKASALLKKTLASATVPGQAFASADVVRSAVEGTLKGLILVEADLGICAVALIRAVGELASDCNLDAQESMVWAMEGIANATKLMSAAALAAVQDEIESSFMGAGGIFADLCHKAQANS